jgi:hypothetical protein
MLDLKPYYDAVNSAQAEVDQAANEIDVAMADGSDEGKLKALELQSKLDGALAKLESASKLYESRQKADRPNDIAKNYVPVSDTPVDQDSPSQASEIARGEFNKLSINDQAKFIRSGGTVRDE